MPVFSKLSVYQMFSIKLGNGVFTDKRISIDAAWFNASETSISVITEYSINGGVWVAMIDEGGGNYISSIDISGSNNYEIRIREAGIKIYIVATITDLGIGNGCKDVSGDYLEDSIIIDRRPSHTPLTLISSDSSGITTINHSIDNGVSYKLATSGVTTWSTIELDLVGLNDLSLKFKSNGGTSTPNCVSSQAATWKFSSTILSATETHTNPTTNGGSDGSINVTVNNGSGNFTYLWNDGNTNKDRIGLVAGTYSLVITDVDTLDTFDINNILLTEPSEEIAAFPNTFVKSSPINPIRFKENKTGEDLPLENYNFCEQPTENMARPFTPELFNVQDQTILQFITDYEINNIKRINTGNGIISSLPLTLKVNNLSAGQINNISITDNGIFGGLSTIRLNRSNMPEYPSPSIGDLITITYSTSYNGSYSIVDISNDLQYVVINTPYISNETGQIKFVSPIRFNVYELPIIFSDWGVGNYKLIFEASDGFTVFEKLISEYISVMAYTPNTLLMNYSNNDNAFGVVWTTDIIMTKRHYGFFVKAVPTRDSTNYRNSNDSPAILNSYIRNKEEYNLFDLPWFSIQRLALIYSCDNFVLNGKKMFIEELPETEQPSARYMLGKQIIVAEEIGWLDNQNTHDIGETSEDSIVIGGDSQEVLGV